MGNNNDDNNQQTAKLYRLNNMCVHNDNKFLWSKNQQHIILTTIQPRRKNAIGKNNSPKFQ